MSRLDIFLEHSSNEQLFPVSGDAMAPTFLPGDIVAIDMNEGSTYDNPYLVNLFGILDIRRLCFGISLKSGDTGVAIKSDNTYYDDLYMSYSEFERDARIIGPIARVYRAMKPSEAFEFGNLRRVLENSERFYIA